MGQKVNITIDQGTTFNTTYTLTDDHGVLLDLSQYNVASQMRKTYASTNSVAFSASANSTGVITLSMNSYTSSLLTPGRYVYDIDLTSIANNNVTRVIEGIVTVTPQVTR